MFTHSSDIDTEIQNQLESIHSDLADEHGGDNVAVFNKGDAVIAVVGEKVGEKANAAGSPSDFSLSHCSDDTTGEIPLTEGTIQYRLYNEFPEEIADYALDNIKEAVWNFATHDARTLFEMELIRLSPEAGSLIADKTVVGETLRSLLLEKINDVEEEVRVGERSDFTRGEIQTFQDKAVNLSPVFCADTSQDTS
jgi:hypothetical protein